MRIGRGFLFHSVLASLQLALDAAVGNEPPERDEDIQTAGHPRIHKGERNGDEVEHGRESAFQIPGDGRREEGFRALMRDDRTLQKVVGNGRHQHTKP